MTHPTYTEAAQDISDMHHQFQEAVSTGTNPEPYIHQLYNYLGLYLGYSQLSDDSVLDNGMDTVLLVRGQ